MKRQRKVVRQSRTRQTAVQALESRLMLSAVKPAVVGYLPDYEDGGTLLTTLKAAAFEGLTQVNYFSVDPNSSGLLPGTSVGTSSNSSTETTSGYTLNGSSSELSELVAAAHADGVKVDVVVGGGASSEAAALTTVVEGGSTLWQNFAASVQQFATAHGIDGIDLDWEPSSLGPSDQADYGNLIATLRANTSGIALSAAVNADKLSETAGGSEYILNATGVADLNTINVMAYDLEAGNTSPIGVAESALNGWGNYVTGMGDSKTELIFGMPFYGSSGTTWANTQDAAYSTLVSKNGGPMSPSATTVTISGTTWNYNGPTTIYNKATYALTNGYGGAVVWEVGQDYLPGGAYDSTYSLLPQIEKAVLAFEGPTSTAISLSSNSASVSNATESLSFTAVLSGGTVPNGELITLQDASNANAVLATGALSNDATTLSVPAGALTAGTHQLVAVYGGDGSFAASQSNALTQTVQLVVTAVTVNGNIAALAGPQRSMVDSVVYTFSEPVELTQSNAFTLAVHAGQRGTVPTLSWTALDPASSGYSTQWVVSFSGSGVVGNSIADGVYDLSLAAGAAQNAGGVGAIAPAATTFQRLFGDINGDGTDNFTDLLILAQSYGTSQTSSGYIAALDYDANGSIGFTDLLALAQRYGESLPV